jgi:hypothetical protein
MSKRTRSRNGVEAKRRRRRIARRLYRAQPKMILRAFMRALDQSYRAIYQQHFAKWYTRSVPNVFNWSPIYPVVDTFWRAT